MKMTDIGWITPLKNPNIWWITHYRPTGMYLGLITGTTGITGTIQHRPFSTAHSALPIHSDSGSLASAVARRYWHRQSACRQSIPRARCPPALPFPFIIIPWRLILIFILLHSCFIVPLILHALHIYCRQ